MLAHISYKFMKIGKDRKSERKEGIPKAFDHLEISAVKRCDFAVR